MSIHGGGLGARNGALGHEPDWYKDAVLYEVRVRSFFDGNADGMGDLPGLIEKLDYLEDLGVTALWLLPFYPSPLRDDGYDISDYFSVHPDVGTLADFRRFLDEAHARGLRVVTELVLNHTSDQSPWFQRARRAPARSRERDYYVWSDDPDRYRDARIIFRDFEPSNWTWDPVARAYYWHRFFAHQPDLNFENPDVRAALFEVIDFWLGLGVDGLRLDAVPYLYEREGTTCENLPETHAFLRELRARVDARFPGRMLLAEANQWPEEAAAYFGAGDECHMAFHFPVMPRLFMAVRMEDRFPIVDILRQTPEPPPGCQWALFLRNHDELTLEMVTDEERDYMVRAFAEEPASRINLGIRRRLLPLCGNDRRTVELLTALLFALPGTPVLYYGDEIGMGDNVYLGDRNGVRTPMQWSAEKNAGFSRCNPQRLVLPVVVDPEYHYQAVNVEAQQLRESSLLWWHKRLIALRKRHPAFGRGTLEVLDPENPRVLALVRKLDGETVLAVFNLSRFPQPVELDLSAFAGLVPVELLGCAALPVIEDAPYRLTLGGRGFLWLSLEAPKPGSDAPAVDYQPPALVAGAPLEALPRSEWSRDDRAALAEALGHYLGSRRWFAGSGRRVERAELADALALPGFAGCLVVVRVELAEGDSERYLLGLAEEPAGSEVSRRSPHAVLASLESPRGASVIVDPFADPPARRAFVEALLAGGELRGRSVVVRPWLSPDHETRTRAGLEGSVSAEGPRSLHGLPGALHLFGEPCFLDVSRRLDDGPGPALELAERLASRGVSGAAVARVISTVVCEEPGKDPVPIVLARAFVPAELLASEQAHGELGRYFERALARTGEVILQPARELIGPYLEAVALLGRRLAEVQLALGGEDAPPAFAAEGCTPFDQRSTYQTMRNLAGRCRRLVQRRGGKGLAALSARFLAAEGTLGKRFRALLDRPLTARRARILGGLHLGKVLSTAGDFAFKDLGGDRRRPPSERRRKASPFRDAASLVRSFHEAAFAALLDPARVRPEDQAAARPFAQLWWSSVSMSFLGAYRAVAIPGGLIPGDEEELAILFEAFLLESALHELGFALEGRAEVESELELPRRAELALELLVSRLEPPAG